MEKLQYRAPTLCLCLSVCLFVRVSFCLPLSLYLSFICPNTHIDFHKLWSAKPTYNNVKKKCQFKLGIWDANVHFALIAKHWNWLGQWLQTIHAFHTGSELTRSSSVIMLWDCNVVQLCWWIDRSIFARFWPCLECVVGLQNVKVVKCLLSSSPQKVKKKKKTREVKNIVPRIVWICNMEEILE